LVPAPAPVQPWSGRLATEIDGKASLAEWAALTRQSGSYYFETAL